MLAPHTAKATGRVSDSFNGTEGSTEPAVHSRRHNPSVPRVPCLAQRSLPPEVLRGPLSRSLTRSFATLQPRQGGQSAYSPVPPSLPGTASPCQADSPVLPAKASSSVGRNPCSVAKGSSPSAHEGSFRVLQKSVTVQGGPGAVLGEQRFCIMTSGTAAFKATSVFCRGESL